MHPTTSPSLAPRLVLRVFRYPASRHQRRLTPGPFPRYQDYKSALREEFEKKCVYCRKPDALDPTTDHFGVDHYRPRSVFGRRANDYANLFYACNSCNRYKANRFWADPDRPSDPHFVPNPCEHVMGDHLQLVRASVKAFTPTGSCAIQVLRLNAPEAVEFRKQLFGTIVLLSKARAQLVDTQRRIDRKLGEPDSASAREALSVERDRVTADIDDLNRKLRHWIGG